MEIGTKANEIDKIGKVDTSNIAIKVNDKVYPPKRYAIVRVDNVCPARINNLSCNETRVMLHCKCGKDIKNYGDTKEHLIKKVAQIILKAWIDDKLEPNIETPFEVDIAKEIVEFLGVK